MIPETTTAGIERIGPLAGQPSFPTTRRVNVTPLSPLARFILRCPPEAIEAGGAALGLALPGSAHGVSEGGGRAALWLGPDEWLLIAPVEDGASITEGFAVIGAAHSLVDISHRNTGFIVSGTKAVDLLNAGVPLDFHPTAFPLGSATRTLLSKAEIVLWRTATDRFHLECWRSFAPYVQAFLAEAAREYISG